MGDAWYIFFTGLIASLIGAFVGVLLGMWADRWREERCLDKEAREVGQTIIEEIDAKFDGPDDSHLGMRAVALEDSDGYRVEVQAPTKESPKWLREMVQ